MAAELYKAHYNTTADPEVDAQTSRLGEKLQSMEEILATCAKFSIRARVELDGKIVGEVVNQQFVNVAPAR
jgi:hypothetical protein